MVIVGCRYIGVSCETTFVGQFLVYFTPIWKETQNKNCSNLETRTFLQQNLKEQQTENYQMNQWYKELMRQTQRELEVVKWRPCTSSRSVCKKTVAPNVKHGSKLEARSQRFGKSSRTIVSLFVSAGLAYKAWLKVLPASLVWEKNTVQAMDYKPDTSNLAETNRISGAACISLKRKEFHGGGIWC